MLDGEDYPYEIIRHNHQKPESGGVTVDIVRGLSAAERAVAHFNQLLTAEQREAGWSHFSQRTTKKPWPKSYRRVTDYKPGHSRKR